MAIGEILALIGGNAVQSAGQLYASAQQRHWEQYMSNTAHQRETADLIAAGLNPILSVNKGASTPSVGADNPMAGAADTGRSLALDIKRIENETRMTEANSAKAEADKRNTDADTIAKLQLAGRGDLITDKLLAETGLIRQQTRTSSAEQGATNARESATRADQAKTEQETIVLKAIVPFIKQGSDAIKQLADALSTGGKMGDAAYDLVEAVKKAVTAQGGGATGLDNALRSANPVTWGRFIMKVVETYAPTLFKPSTSPPLNMMDPTNADLGGR